MSALIKLRRRIRSLVGSRRLKRDIDEELRFHLDQRAADNIAAGMTKEEAERDARKRFGNWQRLREDCRAVHRILWLDHLFQDFRFGFRILGKQPGSLLAALAALTLGIGLVTIMLCAINTLMFRSLPLPDPERLISTTVPAWALPEFRKQQTTFEGLVSFGDFHANFKSGGASSRREACFISANFLDVMRAKPLLGRDFLPGEDNPAAEPVAILSYKLWQEEFQGDRAVLGSTVWVEGAPKTVVGVMPAEFRFPINDDLWVAADVTQAISNRETGFVFGRLKHGVTWAGAQAELNTIWMRLQPRRGGDQREVRSIRVGAYVDALTGALYGKNTVGSALLGMLLVTLFVLFLACANVAMLTLGRAIKRGREFAVRGALGATRRRLVFQMLAENLVLFTGGAVGGTLAAGILLHWLLSRMPSDTTHWRLYASWWHFEIDGHVLFLVACLIFLTNLVAGLWPALQATKRDVNESLKGQTLLSSHLGTAGFQKLLVISQVCAALVILVGAFALIRQRQHLSDVHLPFDPKTMITVNVDLTGVADVGRFFDELDQNLNQMPGVEAAALTSDGFAFWHGVRPVEIEGESYPREADHPLSPARVVTRDFFHTVNLALLQGRGFGEEDRPGSDAVAVVNATFVRRFLPQGNPLGRRFREGTSGPWFTVVGCVSDVLSYGTNRREPVYYLPLSQHPVAKMEVLLRSRGRPPSVWSKIVDAEAARLHPDLPAFEAATVQQELDGVDAGVTANSLLLGACGTVSLFLAAVGVFGLITLSVNQRTNEIGIRLALGSTKARIVTSILRQAMAQIGIGLTAGFLLSLALVRMLGSVLPETAGEPVVYLGGLLLLGAVSLGAVLIPAVRGARIEPSQALRYE